MLGAGGTSGGILHFLVGMAMTIAGFYLLTNMIQVSSGFWGYRYHWGQFTISPFGVTLIPFMLGIVMLFYNYQSVLGKLLAGGSFLAIIIGVLANLQVYFAPQTLYVTLLVIILFVGGIGLMCYAVLNHFSRKAFRYTSKGI